MEFDDVLYKAADGIATITINRPKQMNPFRGQTVDGLIEAFHEAWRDRGVGAVILTGALARRPSASEAINPPAKRAVIEANHRVRTSGSTSRISTP